MSYSTDEPVFIRFTKLLYKLDLNDNYSSIYMYRLKHTTDQYGNTSVIRQVTYDGYHWEDQFLGRIR